MTVIGGLTPDQQALLSQLLAKADAGGGDLKESLQGVEEPSRQISDALVQPDVENRHAPFPLTDIQMAYWLGRSRTFDLGSVASHGYQEYECPRLDLPRFEAAWQAVIARHDMLRAVVDSNGQMRILPETPLFRIPAEDMSDSPPALREARLDAIRETMAHRVPSPGHWPLLELRVSRLSAERDRIHLSCDAIVADVYSMFLAFDEVGRLYDDPTLSLDGLAFSFRDYVLAIKAQESLPAFVAAERYWLARIDGLSPPPDLPLALTAPSGPSRFVRRTLHLPAPRWLALKRRANALGLTPSLVLLCAYAETLRMWSRNPAFTINLTLFNRLPLHPDIERIMGDFTSTLLLDLGADDAPAESFERRVRRTQDRFWADYEHASFTGVRVLQHLSQKRRAAVSMPIVFTSALGVGDVGRKLDQAGRLLGRPTYGITQTPQVQIDHQVFELDGGLGVNWDVVEGLFAPGVIEAMFAAYRGLLEGLASGEGEGGRDPWSDPRPVQLPMAQRAVRDTLNATAADLGPEGLLHAAVLAQARTTPDRIALIDPERSLSYRTLAAEAEALAGELDARLGPPAGSDELVAVALSKGWRQVVAVLAVLISGRAYMPLDPDLPDARQRTILAEGQPVAVLARGTLAAHASTETACPVLVVEPRPGAALAAHPPAPRSRPRDLAYVIFTSGSTGVPKGVMIEHRAALNTVRDVNARFGIGAEDGVFGLSSLSFDLSVYDLFGPLSCGGRLVLPAPGEARDPEAWAARLTREAVTVWNTVPALWQMLVEHAPRLPSPPRLVLLSGDWIPLDLIPRSRTLFPSSRLVSLGGATEAAIWSVAHPVEEEPGPDWRSVPYGRPLANQRLHVLGPDLSPRPDWVVGDLFIAGDGLARGYWRDPVRTQASFPVHPRSGERLYRTGDLARVRPDGTLEFLGREDQQVKVAGHRIELGEIEAALNRCDGVAGSVAAALGHPPGPRRLAAWIVAADASAPPAVETLRRSLADTLPAYMLPRTIALIDAIPLSQNGKIDRAKLPDIRDTDTETVREVPEGEVETVVAAAVADELGLTAVGATDAFFEIGATSLSIVAIHRVIETKLGRKIPLLALFEHPSARALAQHVEGARGESRLGLADDRAARRKARLGDRRPSRRPTQETAS
ncbi:Phenyloxazoline synthase MbtB [Methylobacterium bullatum]|uniref:Phenyloxazoline synthase MbtB n=1 Tax=Methylobacterium bullatum TaxID=570505 RepID=A0A679J4B3_9HYPH|nr:Phenyloxazoline synthase MbtB [Methylobacterium bullatum]